MRTFTLIFLIAISFQVSAKTQSFISAGVGLNSYRFTALDDQDNEEAMMQNKNEASFSMAYQTVPRPFWSSIPWLGGALGIGLSPFKTTHHLNSRFREADGTKPADGLDLGTEVKGQMFYISPAILLMHQFSKKTFVYAGVGAGVGYATLKGDYYQIHNNVSVSCLNAQTVNDVKANCRKKSVNASGFNLSPVTMAGLSLGWFGLKVEGGGPTIKKGDNKYRAMSMNLIAQFQYFL